MRRTTFSIFSLAVLASTVAFTSSSVSAAPQVRSTYIVTYVDGTNARAEAARLRAQNFSVAHVYENVFPGVAVELPAAAAQAMANNPNVALIEPDGVVTTSNTSVSQSNATWGIDRIDQRDRPLDSTFSYPSSAGTGVTAFILDTGILASHQDLSGRVKAGATVINDGRGTTDCNGHGTHVAGTVGGTVYGVAKKVDLVPVRVLDCNGGGSWSGVIAGMDWVAGTTVRPAVANMSLGGGANSSVDNAVQNMVDKGVTVVVAAGNSNANACNYSPARAVNAITVGATTSGDSRASYSNFGTCLDLFAPGSSITSAWHTSNTAINTISGTSMASPHVAGVAALILSDSRSLSPAQVTSEIVNAATTGLVGSAGRGSPNRLLYSEPGAIQPQGLGISTTSLPGAIVGTVYSATLEASGGTGIYSWTATGLPTGLSLAENGTISGTPTTAGSSSVNVTVTSDGSTATATLSLTVSPEMVLPGAFNKLSPSNGVRIATRNSATLSWASSSGATSYEVCISRSTSCTTWQPVNTSLSATVSGLRRNTTYYWHVRAVNADGTTIADGGTIWRFTTAR